MKFLHTADWQIGMKAAHAGEAGARVREERLAAAKRVIDCAQRAGAEFLLIAGDTFEDNGVDRILVQKVADILAGFGAPVYVIPGNHDPLVPGSVGSLRPERAVLVPIQATVFYPPIPPLGMAYSPDRVEEASQKGPFGDLQFL